MSMYKHILAGSIVLLAVQTPARAVTITYMVEFGSAILDPNPPNPIFIPNNDPQFLFDAPLADGSTLNLGDRVAWQITATITDVGAATNFGVAQQNITLTESMGNTLNTANQQMIDMFSAGNMGDFFDYDATLEGAFAMGSLVEIGATQFSLDATVVGGGMNPPTLIVASGSYELTTLGTHTLSLTPGSENRYYTAIGQTVSQATTYESIITSDTAFVEVVPAGIPEPGSMLLASTLLGPGLIAVRRRRRRMKQARPVDGDSRG